MELFNKNIVMKDWGTVYAGLKRQWLTPKEVIKYCEKQNILCSEERFVQLYLALEESVYEFFELIKKFVLEDGQPPIEWNEDSTKQDFSIIPKRYWDFWEIEFLLRIVNSKEDMSEKLNQVAAVHSVFDYPKRWHGFLYYMPIEKGKQSGIKTLYDNLKNYVNRSLKNL